MLCQRNGQSFHQAILEGRLVAVRQIFSQNCDQVIDFEALLRHGNLVEVYHIIVFRCYSLNEVLIQDFLLHEIRLDSQTVHSYCELIFVQLIFTEGSVLLEPALQISLVFHLSSAVNVEKHLGFVLFGHACVLLHFLGCFAPRRHWFDYVLFDAGVNPADKSDLIRSLFNEVVETLCDVSNLYCA